MAQLQHLGSLDIGWTPTVYPHRQIVQEDEQKSLPPFGSSSSESEDNRGHNDAVRPMRSIKRRIRGRNEAVDSAPANADRTKERPHQKAEPTGEEAHDEDPGSEDVAPKNQAHDRTLHTSLRRGKRKWKIRCQREDQARPKKEKKERTLSLTAPARTSPDWPLPRQLVGVSNYSAPQKGAEAEEGGQPPFHKELGGGEKRELTVRQRKGA